YGEKEFELKHRPILGSSTIEAPGPGFRFQIDATIADIYIVSEIDRSQVIGRPTVYIIIDVFSRMITGVYVGLESPSWNGAMMALDSMVADKTELCKKYNINIEPEDWPCSYVPEAIIADRGEMEGYGVTNLINNLSVTIENTSPYRGDYKGIVERFFRTINERIESFLPGAIMKDYRKRGDPDYRLEAKLTLKEITEIVLRSVLLHNIREIEKYPLTPEMIRDEVPPTPLDLWNWGIENKKGTLRKIDRNRFRMNILPRGKATISRGAVVFRNLHYGASELLDENFYKRLKVKSVDIVYDTRNMEHIYWLKEDGMSYITFNLLERSRDFKGMFLEDVVSANNKAAKLRQVARKSQLQQETELDQTIMKIAKESTKKTNEAIDSTVSKVKRLKDIKSNRAEEKERNRKEEAFIPDEDQKDAPTPIISFPDVEQQISLQNEPGAETSDFNSRMMEKIRLRKEKLKNDKNET
ncbi:MAG TPA: Mu transposase C-terminal domain-containing protein, partial [Desulfosporosinus sp.]|nr:Mu transposase C-terminal domain-containing protein [Desulfosporosinus sp.]